MNAIRFILRPAQLAAILFVASAITAQQEAVLSARQERANVQTQSSLKLVDNPGGGQFVYGDLTGKGTLPEAIVYMLRQVHGHFGDKPQVGKFFQSRDGSSVATFFTVAAKNQGNKPISGLLIVQVGKDSSASAAVVYDDSSRFATTEGQMMKSLAAAWHPVAANASTTAMPVSSTSTRGPAQQRPTPQLMPASGGDNSAAIKLPQGWHVTGVAGGQLTAEGDRGEMVSMGLIWGSIMNPQSQVIQQQMKLPALARGPHVFAVPGGDLFASYVSVLNQRRRNDQKPPATAQLISQKPIFGGQIQAIFLLDLKDGKGPRRTTAQIGTIGGQRGAAQWAITVTAWSAPVAIADEERSLLWAVVNTYSQNGQVIALEHEGDMTRIQGDIDRSNIQNTAINQRRENSTASFNAQMKATDERNGAVDKHMDAIDWQSKIQQDYTLDRSVIQDNELQGHATVTNRLADALIQANPTRFELVPNQQLIKGLDY